VNELQRWAEIDVGGSPLWRWALGVGVAVLSFLVLLTVRRLAVGRLTKVVDRAREAQGPDGTEHTRLNDFVLEPIKATRAFFLFVLSLYIGTLLSPLSQNVHQAIDTAMVLAALVQLGLLAQNLIGTLSARWLSRREAVGSATLAAGMRFAAKVVIWAAIILMVLSNLGVEISALIAGLGVGGVAAALAVQNILGDLFASLALYFDRPFDIGDSIKVGEDSGTVIRIGLRSTRVRSVNGEEIIVPNADMMQSRIHNYRRMSERRVLLQIGVLHGTTAEEVAAAAAMLKEAIESVGSGIRFDRAHFKGFGPASLDFEAVYWIQSREYGVFMDQQQAVNLEIMRRFEAAGLDFAFPTRTQQADVAPEATDPSPGAKNPPAVDSIKGRTGGESNDRPSE
jgi:small-conductance mechanosensitive channel